MGALKLPEIFLQIMPLTANIQTLSKVLGLSKEQLAAGSMVEGMHSPQFDSMTYRSEEQSDRTGFHVKVSWSVATLANRTPVGVGTESNTLIQEK